MTTWTVQTRFALGVAPSRIPAAAVLLIGLAAGPAGLGLLSTSVLTALDPATSAAIAALGVLIGLDVDLPRRRTRSRLLAAATVEAGVTIAVLAVVFAMMAMQPEWRALAPWTIPLMLGICGASSGTAAIDEGADTRQAIAARAGDLNDVLPVIVGAAVLAWMAEPTAVGAGWLLLNATGIAAAAAVAGTLLLSATATDGEGEQRVYSVGVLLLLAGAATYLSTSALYGGFVAGVIWNAVDGNAQDRIARDIGYLQHPLIVVLLLIAGARLSLTSTVIELAGWFVVCRIVGKLVGGWAASRAIDRTLPANLGLRLIRPGIAGVAFALNAVQVANGSSATGELLSIVVAAAIVSDLLSRVLTQGAGETLTGQVVES